MPRDYYAVFFDSWEQLRYKQRKKESEESRLST